MPDIYTQRHDIKSRLYSLLLPLQTAVRLGAWMHAGVAPPKPHAAAANRPARKEINCHCPSCAKHDGGRLRNRQATNLPNVPRGSTGSGSSGGRVPVDSIAQQTTDEALARKADAGQVSESTAGVETHAQHQELWPCQRRQRRLVHICDVDDTTCISGQSCLVMSSLNRRRYFTDFHSQTSLERLGLNSNGGCPLPKSMRTESQTRLGTWPGLTEYRRGGHAFTIAKVSRN